MRLAMRNSFVRCRFVRSPSSVLGPMRFSKRYVEGRQRVGDRTGRITEEPKRVGRRAQVVHLTFRNAFERFEARFKILHLAMELDEMVARSFLHRQYLRNLVTIKPNPMARGADIDVNALELQLHHVLTFGRAR